MEQCPPGLLAAGLDKIDFLLAAAPKPVLILGQKYDFFDLRGFEQAANEMRKIYRLLAAPRGTCDAYYGPGVHGFGPENRQAMVRFFCRHAGLVFRDDFEPKPLAPDDLSCCRGGKVAREGSKPIYELIRQKADQLKKNRPKMTRKDLPKRLAKLLGMENVRGVPNYRHLRPRYDVRVGKKNRVIERFAVETEPGILAILKRAADFAGFHLECEKSVRLVLPHLDGMEELRRCRIGDWVLDVRGLGESMPVSSASDFFEAYGWDYMFHAHGLMLNRSYLGRRVVDVMRTISLLRDRGAERIELEGRGQGSLVALFTACLDERVDRLIYRSGPRSFHDLTTAPIPTWPAAMMPFGILRYLDLPDCLRFLGRRASVVKPSSRSWGQSFISH